ncbi:hypothetical protein [Streptomyces sp. NPDC006631]|uniref:DUF7848 domain-containing protein n=1 Tax=Streptomyces sp. NPDC006631 TaxID=3364752 RepID=UPI0036979D59
MKSLYRFVDYSIGLDPHAERDMEEMACTTCGDLSGCLPFGETQDWAIQHAAKTGHTGFRQVTTNYHRVVRNDRDLAPQLSVPAVFTPGQVVPPERA